MSHVLFVLSGATYSAYWVLQEMAPGPATLWTFLLSLVFGLVCYAVYFLLEGRARFFAGLVPYGVVSLAMLLVAVLLLLEQKEVR